MSRILHLIPSMGGGGAERQLAMLAAQLPAEGWEVDVAFRRGGPNLPRLERSGATLHHLQVRNSYDPMLYGRLARLMRDIKPDLVQTWLPPMDIAGGLMTVLRGVPWIVSERATKPLPPSLKKKARDFLVRRATAVISNSTAALEVWQRERKSVARYHVANAVPLPEIDAAPVAGWRAGKKVVLAAGRLIEQKNFDVFVEAMAHVVREVDAVALICGTGPRYEILRAAAEAVVPGRIIFSGFVEDLWSHMKAADLFVSLSHAEGRPNTVIEAMACRTPVILSDIPEHREVADESAACFVDRRDAAAVASVIIEELRDPSRGERRAAVARTLVDRWTVASVAKEYATIYRAVIRGRA